MLLVGLTGGIGSGKTTVARRLAQLGAEVVDADAVARDIVEPGEPALAELAAEFGAGVLDARGRLDRAALAELAFTDAGRHAALERITHPYIAAGIDSRLQEIARRHRDGADPVVVVDHPLLVETGQADRFDVVVVVVADVEQRVSRLVEDRGMADDDVRRRIATQADDAVRRSHATHVLENTGAVTDLLGEVDRLYDALVEAARGRPGR